MAKTKKKNVGPTQVHASAQIQSQHAQTGIQEVYAPKNRDPDIDIVFVHGLNPINQKDYIFTAWSHPNGIFWPRDILPVDIPGSRIMMFGYNSNVAFDVSAQTTREHADALLERLSAHRESPAAKLRPIILIGHSLGGLVIKQALVTANHNSQMYGELRESVRGLVFFGTPHKGGNNVSLGKIGANIILTVGGSVSNNLLHTIEKDSAFARNLSGDFRHQLDDYRILTFFETRKTKLKKSWFFGRYLKALVVDSTSAKMQVHQEVQIAMDTDHTMMCKFAAKDYVYEPVGHNICTMVKQCIADQKERIQMKYLAPKEELSAFHFEVPFAYNPAFIGRRGLIELVSTKLSTHRHQRLALWGLGGVGKTQIALDYAYGRRNTCPVYWIHADNLARFSQDYREIAKKAGLPESSESMEELMFQTKAWLESPKSGPWTMIVDNADNLLEMFPPKDEDGNQPIGLASFLPQGSKGTILITTRDRIVASRLANTDMHEVKALGLVEAEDLLVYYAQDAISGTREREAIPKLLEVLKYLPLAIVATAAFMRETGTFPTEYIELYSQGRMAQRELLCSELSDFHVPEAVLTIYFTLFGWLQRQSPMATEFLRLIAFLDRNGIPKELLIKSGIDGVESPARFARAIGKLFSCSLITKSSDGKMYQVHQLVHISIGMFFPDDDNKWKLRALDTLLSIFQVTTDKGAAGRECNWDLCAKYSPHAISVLKSLEDTSSTAGMQLSSRLGIYFGLIGRYEDAQLHLKQAIKLHESETEGDLRKNDIIDAYLSLGQVFEVRDRANDATELYLGVLGRCEKEFGPEHTSVATLLDRLTKLFKKHQNFSLEKAEELGRRALAGKQKLLAPEHLDLVPDINNLAKVLRLQLRFGEAVQLLQRAVMLAETHLDPKDPAVLLSLIRLSRALQLDLNYPEAQRILDQALQASEAITTSDPATLRSFTKLGRALFCQGNTTQSSQILQRAITISQTLQADDATAVPSQIWVTKLAKLLHLCGNIQQAESTYTLVLRRNQQLPGPSHAHMLENLFSLGDVLRDLNHFSEAEDAYQRALGGFETAYGPSNQNTINCRARLGILHAFQGNRVGAEQECKDVHEAYRNVYGKDHLRTLRTKAVMDFCLFEAGDMEGKTVFETVKTAQYVAILMFPPPPMPPVAPARVKRVSTAEILSDEPLD